jgi:large conductance mechanosensitive channel
MTTSSPIEEGGRKVQAFLQDFKKFLLRGNVVDLAVAVVIGAAFKAIVDSLVNDIVMPIIAAVFGKPDFSDLTFTLGSSVVRYGSFITQVVNFLIIGVSLYVAIKAFEALEARRRAGEEPEPPEPTEVELLRDIRDALRAGPAMPEHP